MNTQTVSNSIEVDQLFESMWQDYLALNPEALKIFQLFSQKDRVINDHVAFRTFGLEGMRVEDLAQPLIDLGYQEVHSYDFQAKKLRAKHYAHELDNAPLVFISELIVEAFPLDIQILIKQLASQTNLAQVKDSGFLYSGRPWSIVSEVYDRLLEESEYAAWVAAFGFRPNHFTVSINELSQFTDLQSVNEFVKANGFKLNNAGGEIKGTPESYLEQSSTMANKIEVEFANEKRMLPSCFYEFALRHKLSSGELFKGFIASSADKIFESTDAKVA